MTLVKNDGKNQDGDIQVSLLWWLNPINPYTYGLILGTHFRFADSKRHYILVWFIRALEKYTLLLYQWERIYPFPTLSITIIQSGNIALGFQTSQHSRHRPFFFLSKMIITWCCYYNWGQGELISYKEVSPFSSLSLPLPVPLHFIIF